MRKQFTTRGLVLLLLLSIFFLPQNVAAELNVGAQAGYGETSYAKVLGTSLANKSEWSARIWGNYVHEDALITGLFQSAHSLKDQGLSRNLAQIGANYLFLDEEALKVYGGLGYQLLNAKIKNGQVEAGEAVSFTGQGFIGQAVVSIAVSEQVKTTAKISGNPWTRWSFSKQGVKDSNLKAGAAFVYQVDLTYDFSTDLGASIGIFGGNFKVPSFTLTNSGGETKEETKGSYTSISLGVTHRF